MLSGFYWWGRLPTAMPGPGGYSAWWQLAPVRRRERARPRGRVRRATRISLGQPSVKPALRKDGPALLRSAGVVRGHGGMLAIRLCVREDRLSRSSCPRHGDRDPLVEQVIPFWDAVRRGRMLPRPGAVSQLRGRCCPPCADHLGDDARARRPRGRGDRMKCREFIVLVDGAAAASQDGSIASVYLRPCDPGDKTLRWHPRQ